MDFWGFELNQLPIGLVLVDMFIRVSALFIVPRNRRPSSGTAWLLFIFLLPIPAAILFLVIGSRRLPRIRRRRHSQIQKELSSVISAKNFASLKYTHSNQGIVSAIKVAHRLGVFPMLSGNSATLHSEYHDFIAQLAAAIDEAKEFVHLEFYILVSDGTTEPVFAALRRASARGIKIKVLIDHISALRNPGYRRTRNELQKIGAELHYMLPIRLWRLQYQRPDLRNHRKLAVIDGTVGFMGSQNLVDSSYNKLRNRLRGLHWRDLMIQVTGPSVMALEAIFQADWYAETGERITDFPEFSLTGGKASSPNIKMQLLPSGPGYATENNLQVFVALMYAAQQRIVITSPYFIPDGALTSALKAATARGVVVELFVSEISDQWLVYHAQRSYYEELLAAGVQIYLFRSPYILHAKHFVVDSDIAVIGSSNMDQRSFNLNFEISLIVEGAELVADLDRVIAEYRSNSRELTAQQWAKQSLAIRLLDNMARLTSALQ